MKKDNQILCVFVALFISVAAAAQSNRIDSLQRLVNNSKEDTLKVNHLLLLSKAYISSAPDDAIKYSLEARDLSRKLDFKPGIGYALKNIGMVYYNQTKYVETIEYWNQSHAIFDSIQDHVNVSLLLSNLGSVYMNQGDDAKALEYYLQSLQIAEKINDKQKIAIAMGNIGTIYSNNRSTYETALEYYLKALPLSEELEDKNVMGGLLVNIGETYLNKDKNDSALFYLKRSLKAYENTENIPYSLNDIGKTYTKKGSYDVAERYHQQALAFAKKFELQLDITQSYLGLGTAYSKQKKYTSALNAYNLAKSMAGSINLKKELKDAYQGMATTYASMKDFGNAFYYQTLYTDLKDTLINIDIAQKITNLQTNFDIQKKQGQIDLLTKDKALQELDIRR
ncbi:MAG TPA: tetratricopeptide repeat protein, partial [Flavitalea sp.]|nr:tetratricopeptide repeat protein [Flavitalea sp.]